MTLKNSKTENKALKLIYGAGKEGIYQSEIRKRLDVSSREASRLAKKFETNGKIVREKVLINGRWTFNIVSIKKYVTIKSIEGNPCLIWFGIN